MPLVDVGLNLTEEALPDAIRRLLAEADRRIEVFQQDARVPAFVPSDFVRVYRALRAVIDGHLAPGRLFCEWGSGFGVVTCCASLVGFEAVGIEIDAELVVAARSLADDFELGADFILGSFVPAGFDLKGRVGDSVTWITATASDPDEVPDPSAFDVIFAYPWTGERDAESDIFERYARPGALLITYHGGDQIRVRRRTR